MRPKSLSRFLTALPQIRGAYVCLSTTVPHAAKLTFRSEQWPRSWPAVVGLPSRWQPIPTLRSIPRCIHEVPLPPSRSVLRGADSSDRSDKQQYRCCALLSCHVYIAQASRRLPPTLRLHSQLESRRSLLTRPSPSHVAGSGSTIGWDSSAMLPLAFYRPTNEMVNTHLCPMWYSRK